MRDDKFRLLCIRLTGAADATTVKLHAEGAIVEDREGLGEHP